MNRRLQNAYLSAMGIRQWVARDTPAVLDEAAPMVSSMAPPGAGVALEENPVATLDWAALQQRVENCTRCPLHETRTRTVFGTGNRNADWLIIGEAPGRDEDREGEPFVGRAGKLLTEMLFAAGYQREDVYIANILKCRPPNNRDPSPEEVACCHAYLERQIDLIQPALILAVGRIAAHNLLHSDLQVGRLRGRVHRYGQRQIPLIVTYHPAYLLRSPLEKRKVWDDLQLAQETYRKYLAA
ncbi:MAG: uracil-DNA glycosylase, partial [Gammaproteobacteria bacterium]